MFENVKTLFFDYDGCIHNSIKIYAPAFKKAYSYLVSNGYTQDRNWKEEEISYWLGFNSYSMWKNFIPSLDENIARLCSQIIEEEMVRLIKYGKPKLYDGAIDVLTYLRRKNYKMIFISNCNNYYKEYHKNLFNLDKYFDELVCSEDYNYIPKSEILKIIKPKYPEDMIIIGDRKHDMEAGKKNNIYTFGCTYGYSSYGELDEADLLIDNIKKLKDII